ncbi:MAG: general secretion pathway protein GspK [Deltaproteobacteria bacterium]|nr:general secretion pathway protein GspK [Deltaproteobacteria bacterium]
MSAEPERPDGEGTHPTDGPSGEPPQRPRVRNLKRSEGAALIIVMTSIAVLLVTLTEFHASTSTALVASTADRDALKAEYLARSGVNLTRLLLATEPQVRTVIGPILAAMTKTPSTPQLNVWDCADTILGAFSDYEANLATARSAGVDMSAATGVGNTGGRFEVLAITENAMLNISRPVANSDDVARQRQALCLYGLLGGFQEPSPYDALFERRDADGQFTTREDVIASIIDWWDYDTERTTFDPAAGRVTSGGAEDDLYSRLRDPYDVKNAPFDSIEELRLVRGMSDEMWANLVEPDPDDPRARVLTIYGSGNVNVNYGSPQAIWCAICSQASTTTLCTDPAEATKFVTLLNTIRSMARIPMFQAGQNNTLLAFVRGQGLYQELAGFLGEDNPLLFKPIQTPPGLENAFVDAARIFSLYVTGVVGQTRVRIHTVANLDETWNPPPPNTGGQTPMGVLQYWRMD